MLLAVLVFTRAHTARLTRTHAHTVMHTCAHAHMHTRARVQPSAYCVFADCRVWYPGKYAPAGSKHYANEPGIDGKFCAVCPGMCINMGGTACALQKLQQQQKQQQQSLCV